MLPIDHVPFACSVAIVYPLPTLTTQAEKCNEGDGDGDAELVSSHHYEAKRASSSATPMDATGRPAVVIDNGTGYVLSNPSLPSPCSISRSGFVSHLSIRCCSDPAVDRFQIFFVSGMRESLGSSLRGGFGRV